MPRPLAFVVACAAATLCAAVPGATSADDAPRKLRHVLRYVAADYRHAVRDGQVRSQAEYEEQLTLLNDARRLAAAVPGDPGPVAASIAIVRALVEQKAPERAVTSAVAAAEAQLVGLYHLRDRPASAPDLARGAALYLEHCATCHGPAGRADTARARSLSPPPPDLHEPALGEGRGAVRRLASMGARSASAAPAA
jgi:high-affinity iron transporter